MNKNELIELKRRIEIEKRNKSKYILQMNYGSIDDITYSLEDIKSECNEKGAVDNIEKLFEKLIYHYEEQNIRYDTILITFVHGLFYKECDYENHDLTEDAMPAYDYAGVEISFFCSINNGKKYEEDPTELLRSHDRYYVVSLSEFKKELISRGFNISDIHSFKEIYYSLKKNGNLVSYIAIDFSKHKVKQLKLGE